MTESTEINGMKIAIIPARGGSKRIPRKNIKPFLGKPIIAYSIEAALASDLFDKVIVSTDDAEIASVAREYGAEVPFMRPANLADDMTGTVPVIIHAIEELTLMGLDIELVCCIYATAPFLQSDDLKNGFLLLDNQIDYSFSATSFAFPIQRAIKIDSKQKVSMFYPEFEQTRSQDLPEAHHDAGQFYWGKSSAFLQSKGVFSGNSKALVMPRIRVQDIDTYEDWGNAEVLYQLMLKKRKSV